MGLLPAGYRAAGGWESPASILAATGRREGDVAVLEVENPPPGHPSLPLCSDEPEPPFIAYIIGYPSELLQLTGSLQRLSMMPRVYASTVSWFDPVRHLYEIGRTDTGNSGGPVVTTNGCVVAIVSFALRGGASELFFDSSVYWVKLALRRAGVAWREEQAAVVDVGELPRMQGRLQSVVSSIAEKVSSPASRLEDWYWRLYSLYSADPVFFTLMLFAPILGLAAVASLLRGRR